MPKKHLSSQFLRNLKPEGKRTEYFDQHLVDPETSRLKRKGVKGLLLRLTKAGNKYFYYSYWFDEKSKRFKIGSYPNIGLSEARDKARELAGKVNSGIDPQAEKNKRKHQPDTKNFKELAADFQQRHLPTLRESTQAEYKRIIENELQPTLKDIPVTDITSHHLRKILDDKAIKDGSPTMANRIRAVLSSIFKFAIKKVGIKLKENPITGTSPYKAGENKRDRVYNEDEIKILWGFFDQLDEPIRSVLKMLLLTGQRKTETMRMKWTDIELDKPYKRIRINEDGQEITETFLANVWTIPAGNAKNKQEHEVPLSDAALQIIEGMKPISGDSDFVFESSRIEGEPVTWLKSSVRMVKKHSGVDNFRLHDLRRTAATYMAELGVYPMVIGKVLNHKGMAKENTITARYNRHDYMDKKKNALNRWSYRLKNIISGNAETKITKIS